MPRAATPPLHRVAIRSRAASGRACGLPPPSYARHRLSWLSRFAAPPACRWRAQPPLGQTGIVLNPRRWRPARARSYQNPERRVPTSWLVLFLYGRRNARAAGGVVSATLSLFSIGGP